VLKSQKRHITGNIRLSAELQKGTALETRITPGGHIGLIGGHSSRLQVDDLPLKATGGKNP